MESGCTQEDAELDEAGSEEAAQVRWPWEGAEKQSEVQMHVELVHYRQPLPLLSQAELEQV